MPTYRLSEHISDLKTKLRAATFSAVLKTATSFKRVGVWNDQLNRVESGKGYSFKTPAAFIQMNHVSSSTIGKGITDDTYIWTIHLILDKKDAGSNDMDENLDIFILRDAVKDLLHMNRLLYTGTIEYMGERQDFAHEAMYHYEVDFSGVFRDVKGSACDPDTTKYVTKQPPTGLNLNVEYVDSI